MMQITSLNARRMSFHVDRANQDRARALRHLSSGRRIVSAQDDEAGLAIASRLGARTRGLNAAVRNANDGISMMAVADAGLSGSASILARMRELAIGASTDTATSLDRNAMQRELEQLRSEIDRSALTAEFNTHRLLDGSLRDFEFHIGPSAGQTVTLTVSNMRANALGQLATASSIARVNSVHLISGELALNGVTIGTSKAADDTLSTTLSSASAIAKAAIINAQSGLTGVTAIVSTNVLTGAAAVSISTLASNDLVINGVDVGVVENISANDDNGVLTAAINAVAAATGITASLNEATGRISLTADDGRNIDVQANGAASTFFQSGAQLSNLTLTSLDDFIVGGEGADAKTGITSTLYLKSASGSLAELDISTKQGGNDALVVLDTALEQILSERTKLGALRNGLESAIGALSAAAENGALAKSRIMDADFASETAELTRADIMLNASVAVMAQAIDDPTAVLSLIS